MPSGLSKWIVDLPADATPGEWALHSIKLRLGAVRYCLPRAAKDAARDTEYMHQLRVATRRDTAVLKVYGELLPDRQTRKMRKLLAAVRRAAGHARDLDVMLLRHGHSQQGKGAPRFLRQIHRRRDMAQLELAAVRDALRSAGGLKRQFDEYADLVRQRIRRTADSTGSFSTWAAERLQHLLQEFLAAVPDSSSSEADLHEFRIRGKQLRYAMELLSAVFSSAFRDELYPRLEDLLEQLGIVHDHAVAIEYFRNWLQTTRGGPLRKHLQLLIERETSDLQESLSRFRHSWNAGSFRDLSAAFDAILTRSESGRVPGPGSATDRDQLLTGIRRIPD